MHLKTCINIGDKYIKVIEGYEKKGELYLLRMKKIENPVENFEKISEEDVEKLGNFLHNFLKKNGFVGKIGIFSPNEADVIYHYFELPKLNKDEFENAIKLEGLQTIPNFIENYEYDYISFDINNKRVITLIAYPKNKVNIYCNILLKSGLRPLIMDNPGIAVLNSFLYFKKEEQCVCIINIEQTFSNLVIYLKNKFIFIRDISWGIQSIIEKEDNEKKFLLKEAANNLCEEINVSLKYFNNKTGENVSKIYLTGEIMEIEGLKNIIEENTDIFCEYYNPLLNFTKGLSSIEEKEEGILFSICIGLLTRKIT
ncbi:MAG: pilus assembly protein PilM [bacterium]|nr:pilus assembly protein PilM [bacterium]